MIKRLLVANRGEIALRVIAACRELGIESVAIFSEPDRHARHVLAADRAVAVGPAAPSESYLNARAILDAARSSGADAVHPGYGFLSENADFAARCEHASVVFVGPPASVLRQLGSKIQARRLMHAAGVPVVPGETPTSQSDDGLAAALKRVGFPALVKAAAGGGGKGMRLVSSANEAAAAIQAARREALASFGDATLYVERLLERPRHIEVQIFGDVHGSIVHLFERDCSIQRRHQKVIEESPAPSIGPRLRDRLLSTAVRAASAAEYRNAGTVEFLVDQRAGSPEDAPFFFLEMNTRLQVEHPVTEQITGRDLVLAQLLVASGQPLPWLQNQILPRGCAIEARVYAEDPANDFLPQAGRVLLYREPKVPGIRIDSGVTEGDDVSVHYDPLIAKVIATAETRELTIARLAAALRAYPILGIRTNVAFLLRVIESDAFRTGNVDTAFLDTEGASWAHEEPADIPGHVRAALRAHEAKSDQVSVPDPWARSRSWRP
jgi:acetyl/propionyl-CoA carboxylase alpha subunit